MHNVFVDTFHFVCARARFSRRCCVPVLMPYLFFSAVCSSFFSPSIVACNRTKITPFNGRMHIFAFSMRTHCFEAAEEKEERKINERQIELF